MIDRPRERLVAILEGGDWNDASVDHVVVPVSVNMEEAMKARREWYEGTYRPALQRGERPVYLSFPEWLIEHYGARRAEETDIEVWDEL